MPARNRIKQYAENSYYHIYNRGVEKRSIFQDRQDYAVFLSYLKVYLSPKNEKELLERLSNLNISYKEKDDILKLLRLNNFYNEITLLAYCLMPNHFHFFIKQQSPSSIDRFMQSFGTRYSMYFNRRHKRIGFLYQDTYKAVLIENEMQFLYLSKYIHRQALIHKPTQPSSSPEYMGKRNTNWVHPEEILSYFSRTNSALSYESFVTESDDFAIIQNKLLEED